MPKTKELQEFDRGQIVGAHKFGHSVREIAAQLNIPKSTVQDVISAYQRGQCTPGKSPGRPRKTTPQLDRLIARAARRSPENRRLTLSSHKPAKSDSSNHLQQMDSIQKVERKWSVIL